MSGSDTHKGSNLWLRSQEKVESKFPNLASVLDDVILLRAKTFLKILGAVNGVLGPESSKFWYRLGFEAGEEMASTLIAKMKTKRARIIKFLLRESHSSGWGDITYFGKRFGNFEGTIRVENSPLLRDDASGDACQLYRGYVRGFLNKIYGVGEIKCVENSCLRKGSPFCELRIERCREKWLMSILT